MDYYSDDEIDASLRVHALLRQRETLDNEIAEQVDRMRQEDMSWAKVGLALGVSAQAAWERYSNHERDSEIQGYDVPLPISIEQETAVTTD